MNIKNLDSAIKAVCPIHGVSVGNPDDKQTWRIDFAEESTQPQRESAMQVMAAFSDAPSLVDYDIAIERELDRDAEAAGYRDPLGRIPPIDRACAYAGYPNPYQAEAQSFVVRRAAVWAHVYQVKADVEAELRPQPTIEELIAELPQRVIPE
jgi:hypothetical protein